VVSAIDWTGSVARTYEFYEVDPASWQDVRRLERVASATLTFDRSKDTFGNGTVEVRDDMGEAYVRAYVVAEQGGARERMPVGTFLAQPASMTYNGKRTHLPMQAFTPLIELAENMPPLGFHVPAGRDTLRAASDLLVQHGRAPVSAAVSGYSLTEAHSAMPEETWLDFLKALVAKSGHYLAVDPLGRILMVPEREPGAMQPVHVFSFRNSSVVPDVSDERGVYGKANTYEAVLTRETGGETATFSAIVRNENPASPTSIPSRGRVVYERNMSPEIPEGLSAAETQAQLERFARRELAKETSADHSVTFDHKWMPHVRVGSCVMLDFPEIGIVSRAVVEAQTIKCATGGKVTGTFRYAEVSAL